MSEGIIITFSDQTTAIYNARFLYDVRHEDGNRVLPRENENEMPGHE
jgi:hypothetical protein